MSSVLTLKYELVCRTNVSQDEIKHRILLEFDQQLFQTFSNRSFYVYEILGLNSTNISSSLSLVSIDSLLKFRTQIEFVSNTKNVELKSELNETNPVDLAQFTTFIQSNPLKNLSDLITDFTGLTCNLFASFSNFTNLSTILSIFFHNWSHNTRKTPHAIEILWECSRVWRVQFKRRVRCEHELLEAAERAGRQMQLHVSL